MKNTNDNAHIDRRKFLRMSLAVAGATAAMTGLVQRALGDHTVTDQTTADQACYDHASGSYATKWKSKDGGAEWSINCSDGTKLKQKGGVLQ